MISHATYSPEDNKLRLYWGTRLSAEDYEKVLNSGFKPAPKQELYYAKWTPSREDFAVEMAGEIEPEDKTVLERAEERAARFDQYSANRAADSSAYYAAADRLSERFYMGQPILVGHHSERSARRDQERMHRAMDNSVKNANKAAYWGCRAEGVLHNANRKHNTRTRINRMNKLLADLRTYQRYVNHGSYLLKLWQQIDRIPDLERKVKRVIFYCENRPDVITGRAIGDKTAKAFTEEGTLSYQGVIDKMQENAVAIMHSEYYIRWITHILNRLAYEQSELGEVARFEGELTATILKAFVRTHGAHKPEAKLVNGQWEVESDIALPVHIADGEKLTLTNDDWRDLMKNTGYEVPAPKPRRARNTGLTIPLVNPTQEEAQRLQNLWNSRNRKSCEKRKVYQNSIKDADIAVVKQSVYSNNSKGDYCNFKTVNLAADGSIIQSRWTNETKPVCRIRVFTGAVEFYKPKSVVHIDDKPGQTLPIDWPTAAEAEKEVA